MGEYSHNPLISADTANHGNHPNGLTTRRQDRALMALLESPSIAAAARQAEVGESTLRQWLRDHRGTAGANLGAEHLVVFKKVGLKSGFRSDTLGLERRIYGTKIDVFCSWLGGCRAVGSGTVRCIVTGRPEGCYFSRFWHDLRRLCFRGAVCTEKS